MSSITVPVKWSLSDRVHAIRLFRTYLGKRMNDLILGIVCVLIGSALLLAKTLAHWFEVRFLLSTYYNWQIPALIALGVILIFDLLWIIPIWIMVQINKRAYSVMYDFAFEEGGIEVKGKDVKTQYAWSYFRESVEGSREFILIYEKNRYISIPKKSFRDEQEIETLKALLKRRLSRFSQVMKIPFDFLG